MPNSPVHHFVICLIFFAEHSDDRAGSRKKQGDVTKCTRETLLQLRSNAADLPSTTADKFAVYSTLSYHRRELFELRAGRWGKLLHHIMGDMVIGNILGTVRQDIIAPYKTRFELSSAMDNAVYMASLPHLHTSTPSVMAVRVHSHCHFHHRLCKRYKQPSRPKGLSVSSTRNANASRLERLRGH